MSTGPATYSKRTRSHATARKSVNDVDTREMKTKGIPAMLKQRKTKPSDNEIDLTHLDDQTESSNKRAKSSDNQASTVQRNQPSLITQSMCTEKLKPSSDYLYLYMPQTLPDQLTSVAPSPLQIKTFASPNNVILNPKNSSHTSIPDLTNQLGLKSGRIIAVGSLASPISHAPTKTSTILSKTPVMSNIKFTSAPSTELNLEQIIESLDKKLNQINEMHTDIGNNLCSGSMKFVHAAALTDYNDIKAKAKELLCCKVQARALELKMQVLAEDMGEKSKNCSVTTVPNILPITSIQERPSSSNSEPRNQRKTPHCQTHDIYSNKLSLLAKSETKQHTNIFEALNRLNQEDDLQQYIQNLVNGKTNEDPKMRN